MARKLTLVGAVAAAIAAFAMPAPASASPQLFEGSTALATNASVLLTTPEFRVLNTALGTLVCEFQQMTTRVNSNSGSHVELSGTAGTTVFCTAEGLPLIMTRTTLVSLSTTGGDSGTLSVTFIADVGPFECHFAGTGGFTYGTGGNSFSVLFLELKTAEICEPESGAPLLNVWYSMETFNGTAVTIK